MNHYASKRAALEHTCFRLASLNAPQLPLFRAAADQRIAVVGIYSSDVRWPAAALARLHLPAVVLIGADIGGPEPDQPSERWKCHDKLHLWARLAIVHGAAGEAQYYRIAVAAAARFRRVAFIECRSGHIHGWASLPWSVPPLVIFPRDQAYPASTRPEALH